MRHFLRSVTFVFLFVLLGSDSAKAVNPIAVIKNFCSRVISAINSPSGAVQEIGRHVLADDEILLPNQEAHLVVFRVGHSLRFEIHSQGRVIAHLGMPKKAKLKADTPEPFVVRRSDKSYRIKKTAARLYRVTVGFKGIQMAQEVSLMVLGGPGNIAGLVFQGTPPGENFFPSAAAWAAPAPVEEVVAEAPAPVDPMDDLLAGMPEGEIQLTAEDLRQAQEGSPDVRPAGEQ